MKMYVNIEDLNAEEKKYNKISYRRLIDRISNNIWLFNKAPELSDYDFEFELNSDYDDETDEYLDIYQYYLININTYILEKLQELKCEDVIIAWSEKLEEYVLFVPYFGMSWDYILTSIEPTDNLDESDI